MQIIPVCCCAQTNTDEVSRASLILRAAETVKEQRQDHRDSLVSTNDSVRNALPLTSNNSGVAGDEITKVRFLVTYCFRLFVVKRKMHCFLVQI